MLNALGLGGKKAGEASSQAPTSDPQLRFSVGDRVQCKVGAGDDEDSWAAGSIVKLWYREKNWPPARVAPYQVKLDRGPLIFAPMDENKLIRSITGILATGKIPVTVLTGFLGAGKTTLLNYILKTQKTRKYAVIENEVGSVGIDNELLKKSGYEAEQVEEEITLLDNGCLCCTLRGDLVDAIRGIVMKAQERVKKDPGAKALDGIIIETTGVADPGPICKTFYADTFCQTYCTIDGVITLVDAKHFIQQLTRDRGAGAVNESAQQVAFADKVLLNKVDAVPADELQRVLEAVQGVNSFVPITKCSLSSQPDAIPLEQLLGIDAFDPSKMKGAGDIDLSVCGAVSGVEQEAESTGHGDGHDEGHGHDENCTEDHGDGGHGSGHGHGGHGSSGGHGSGHGHGHGHEAFRHDTGIASFVCEISGKPIDFNLFREWMGDVLENAENLYRYKGILAVQNPRSMQVERHILQGVHDMTDMTKDGDWPSDVPIKSQVVLIGKDLDRKDITQTFAQCAVR